MLPTTIFMYTMAMAASYIVINKSQQKPQALEILKLVEGQNFSLKNSPENNPDLLEIDLEGEKKSIGIGEVKRGIKFVAEKPYQESYRYLIIFNADKLTTEAQNSLLKTLEEPPVHTYIFLLSQASGNLLDTITSRCKILKLSNGPTDFSDKGAGKLITMTIGERMVVAEELSKEEKSYIINYLNDVISFLRTNGNKSNPGNLGEKLERIANRVKDLEHTNVNTRLALEELFMNI